MFGRPCGPAVLRAPPSAHFGTPSAQLQSHARGVDLSGSSGPAAGSPRRRTSVCTPAARREAGVMRRACARMTALPGGGLVRAVIGIGTGHFPLEKGGESPPTPDRTLTAFTSLAGRLCRPRNRNCAGRFRVICSSGAISETAGDAPAGGAARAEEPSASKKTKDDDDANDRD